MKNVAIAIAVLGLAGTANAATVYKDSTTDVDVYGSVKGAHTFNETQKKNGKDATEFQAGVKAKQQLNDTFALTGQYEGQYNLTVGNTDRHYRNRKAWVGVDAGEYGAVSVGRQMGAVYNVAGFTDIAPAVVSGWSAGADTGLLGRADSVIQYQNKIGNTTVTNQYKLGTTKSLETGKSNNEGEAYGVSVTSNNINDTGLYAGAAYAHQKVTTAGFTGSDVYSVGGGWTDGSYNVAGTSTFGKNTAGAKSFYDNEVIAQYNYPNGVTPSIGYVDSNAGGSRAKFVETGFNYAFNKNVNAGVDVGWDVAGKKDDQVKTYLKYAF